MSKYRNFLRAKQRKLVPLGFDPPNDINAALFPWQADIVRWAIKRGRAALFEDCGLGKTLQQLEWARCVFDHTGSPVVIHCPLGVRHQTLREAKRFNIAAPIAIINGDSEVIDGINLINYEKMAHLNPSKFAGVVLDESSILKSYTGKTKQSLIDSYLATPYRLACTATPAPNDHMELGNHAEFLGVMPSNEMLSRWFVNDTMKAGGYRLRGHAVKDFWEWVASWAVCIAKPSDLGYDDTGFLMPDLTTTDHIVHVEMQAKAGFLFHVEALSATSVHQEKRRTTEARARKVAEIVNQKPTEAWVVWCDTNYEADELVRVLPSAVEVRGSDSETAKDAALLGFSEGLHRVIITKPEIAGFGMNWQHCANVVFIGLGYSFERYYQAVRRVWRFGQTRPVSVHIVASDSEHALAATVREKESGHASMRENMSEAMRTASMREIRSELVREEYHPTKRAKVPAWVSPAQTARLATDTLYTAETVANN